MINSRVLRAVILLSAIFLSLALGSCSKDSSGPEREPDIEVSPSSLEFEVQAGGVTGKALTIKNEGDADLSVMSISADVEWLSVSMTSCGVSAGSSRSMTVSVDASGMAPGGYGGTITMVSNDPDERTLTVGVTLMVIEGEEAPDIDVTPTDLSFSAPMDSSECKTSTVSNEGDDMLHVTIMDDVAWLSVSPISFSVASGESQDIEVCVDASGLSPENYTAALMIQSNDPDEPTVIVTVTLTVSTQSQPEIDVTPTSLSFEVQEGSSSCQMLNVSNIGDATLNVSSISDDAAWLTESPTSFTVGVGSSRQVTVTADAASLSAGSYSGTITIASNDPDGPTVTVTVALIVTTQSQPDIDVTPTSLSFEVREGSSSNQTLTVSNAGDATLNVSSISDNAAWLTESPTSFTVGLGSSHEVTATANASGLSAGNYSGTITIASNDPDEATVTVTVTLTVTTQSQPDIDVTPMSLSMTAQEGSNATAMLTVRNVGTATLSVTSVTDNQTWLSENPTSFTVGAGSSQSVTVMASAANLSAGSYSGTITIASNDPDHATVTVTVALTVTGGDGTTVEMVAIAGGTFQMGSDNQWAESDEHPVHQVTVSAFSMAKYEATNEEMREVMQWAYDNGKVSANNSTVTNAEGSTQELLDLDDSACEISFSGGTFTVDSGKEDHPCIEVTWYGAQAFCNYLTDMEGLNRCISFNDWSCTWSANGYRLPTEAEWEYACRAGTTTDYYSGDETASGCNYDPNLDLIGWYRYNAGRTQTVGQKQRNDWQLHDMSGNVWEWCWDRYKSGYYDESPSQDPTGPGTGSGRIVRGGSWGNFAQICRSADRHYFNPDDSNYYLGFRPARR